QLAAAFRLQGGKLKVDEVGTAEHGETDGPGRLLHGHVHVVPVVVELQRVALRDALDQPEVLCGTAGDETPGVGTVRADVVVGVAEAHAQLAVEVIVGDDDARLDQHLADRHVQRLHDAANVRKTAGRILDQQRVGARVDGHG